MVVRATLDGRYLDVRRLPDLSPIETPPRHLPVGAASHSHSALTADDSPSPPSSRPATMMVRILDIASGDESIEPIPWPNEGATPLAITFTADDRTLLIGDQDGGITEIDVATGAVSPSRFEGMHGPVVGLWLSPRRPPSRHLPRRHDVDLRRHIGPAARTTNGLGAASRPGFSMDRTWTSPSTTFSPPTRKGCGCGTSTLRRGRRWPANEPDATSRPTNGPGTCPPMSPTDRPAHSSPPDSGAAVSPRRTRRRNRLGRTRNPSVRCNAAGIAPTSRQRGPLGIGGFASLEAPMSRSRS